jgi:16S rRNA U516 pseudouridylate synthase RsuA-like enzyme
MAKKVGNRVVALHRIRVANIKLGKLSNGHWRHLTEDEVRRLLQMLGLQKKVP